MAVPPLVLSTCGTSILTNSDPLRARLCIDHANAATVAEVPDGDRAELVQLIDGASRAMADADVGEAVKSSAEFACLAAAGLLDAQHVLVHTDTWLGGETARILAARLSATDLITFAGLQGRDPAAFADGASSLARWVATELQGRRSHGQRLVFNLTGGFKSLNGFLQTLGSVYADECVYVFERTASPVRIPRLPVRVDLVGAIDKHRPVVRRMALRDAVRADEVEGMPETLLLLVDGQATLSLWGDVAWAELRATWYAKELVPAPPGVVYGPKFGKDAERHKPRTFAVNQVVEELALWVLHGTEPGGAHAVGPLLGDYLRENAPSTHRVHVWKDGDPGRLLFHRNGRELTVDRLLPKSEVGR